MADPKEEALPPLPDQTPKHNKYCELLTHEYAKSIIRLLRGAGLYARPPVNIENVYIDPAFLLLLLCELNLTVDKNRSYQIDFLNELAKAIARLMNGLKTTSQPQPLPLPPLPPPLPMVDINLAIDPAILLPLVGGTNFDIEVDVVPPLPQVTIETIYIDPAILLPLLMINFDIPVEVKPDVNIGSISIDPAILLLTLTNLTIDVNAIRIKEALKLIGEANGLIDESNGLLLKYKENINELLKPENLSEININNVEAAINGANNKLREAKIKLDSLEIYNDLPDIQTQIDSLNTRYQACVKTSGILYEIIKFALPSTEVAEPFVVEAIAEKQKAYIKAIDEINEQNINELITGIKDIKSNKSDTDEEKKKKQELRQRKLPDLILQKAKLKDAKKKAITARDELIGSLRTATQGMDFKVDLDTNENQLSKLINDKLDPLITDADSKIKEIEELENTDLTSRKTSANTRLELALTKAADQLKGTKKLENQEKLIEINIKLKEFINKYKSKFPISLSKLFSDNNDINNIYKIDSDTSSDIDTNDIGLEEDEFTFVEANNEEEVIKNTEMMATEAEELATEAEQIAKELLSMVKISEISIDPAILLPLLTNFNVDVEAPIKIQNVSIDPAILLPLMTNFNIHVESPIKIQNVSIDPAILLPLMTNFNVYVEPPPVTIDNILIDPAILLPLLVNIGVEVEDKEITELKEKVKEAEDRATLAFIVAINANKKADKAEEIAKQATQNARAAAEAIAKEAREEANKAIEAANEAQQAAAVKMAELEERLRIIEADRNALSIKLLIDPAILLTLLINTTLQVTPNGAVQPSPPPVGPDNNTQIIPSVPGPNGPYGPGPYGPGQGILITQPSAPQELVTPLVKLVIGLEYPNGQGQAAQLPQIPPTPIPSPVPPAPFPGPPPGPSPPHPGPPPQKNTPTLNIAIDPVILLLMQNIFSLTVNTLSNITETRNDTTITTMIDPAILLLLMMNLPVNANMNMNIENVYIDPAILLLLMMNLPVNTNMGTDINIENIYIDPAILLLLQYKFDIMNGNNLLSLKSTEWIGQSS